jgi:epoxyqueuosine reductase
MHKADIQSIIKNEGVDHFAIIHPKPHKKEEKTYKNWVKCGFFGGMDYLKKHESQKLHPERILPGCNSIILICVNYFQQPKKLKPGCGRIARYAWGRDYHKVIGGKLKRIQKELEKLFLDDSFKANTDATPLLERTYAAEAGLGYIGKNTMLITKPYGSWVLIGEILTTAKLPEIRLKMNHGSCGTCRKCLDACPTGALINPYTIDARKCISYLTIEHRDKIPKDLQSKMGDWIFGCDRCQEVCPQNVRAKVTKEQDFLGRKAGECLLLKNIEAIKSDKEFTEKFAGTPLMRAKRTGLRRNTRIVSGNQKTV